MAADVKTEILLDAKNVADAAFEKARQQLSEYADKANRANQKIVDDLERANRSRVADMEKSNRLIINDLQKSNKRMASELASRASLLKTTLGAAVGVFTAREVVAGFSSMTGAASDLEETVSKINTLFGREMAEDMERWAGNAAAAMGLASQEALDAAGTMGNMFLQLGAGAEKGAALSREMVQLSADIASFHNVAGGANQVLEAMQAAFRGEYDSLQRYIPTINAAAVEHEALARSGKRSKDELTALDKAIGAYHIILRDAGGAAGDFARTSEGLANQQRILTSHLKDLSAELGEVFIPTLTKSIQFLNDLAENRKFIDWLKLIGVTIDGFIIEPMSNAIGMLSQATEYQADVLRLQIEKQKELIARDMADLGGWRAKIMGADVYQEQLERHNRELEQMRRKLEGILGLSPMYIDIAAVPAAAEVDASGGPAPAPGPPAKRAPFDNSAQIFQAELDAAIRDYQQMIAAQIRIPDRELGIDITDFISINVPKDAADQVHRDIEEMIKKRNALMEQGNNELLTITQHTAEQMQSALSDFFFDAVTRELKSFEDYWGAFWKSMAKMASEAIAQILIQKAIGEAAGSSGGSGGGSYGWVGSLVNLVGNLVTRDSGGPVAPGGLYEIGVPEILHTGGKQYLMMGGKQGGYVEPLKEGGQTGGNVRIINALDPSIVEEWANSPSGERVIMNIIRRNQ